MRSFFSHILENQTMTTMKFNKQKTKTEHGNKKLENKNQEYIGTSVQAPETWPLSQT